MVETKAVSQLNDTVNLNIEAKEEPHKRKPYDDRDLKPGEVLVPMLAFPDRVELLGANTANIRTWHNAGQAYNVMFYPVPSEYKQMAMQQFASELNEFLGGNRDARCLIPQEDGTFRVCPKKNGNNRCACIDCPHNGEYDRQDKTIESLEHLIDEFDFEPVFASSAEEEVMLIELLKDLGHELHEKYPRDMEIVSMFLDDIDIATMISRLNLGRSQGYNVIRQTIARVEKILYSN